MSLTVAVIFLPVDQQYSPSTKRTVLLLAIMTFLQRPGECYHHLASERLNLATWRSFAPAPLDNGTVLRIGTVEYLPDTIEVCGIHVERGDFRSQQLIWKQ